MSDGGIVIFVGPSLSIQEVRDALPGALILPPACQGDVYRAARDLRPRAIGLIDGRFATVAAVWHREILWAMAEAGVRVFGAGSMGALRAAELDSFGMVGIGKIYKSYRAGRYEPFADLFEDDDEVAVRHGPPETNSVAVSVAMVDIRETLASAESAGVIGHDIRDRLAAELKARHFPERSPACLETAAAALLNSDGDALVKWLRVGGFVSQKRRDALALLGRLASGVDPIANATFDFQRAQVWERFVAKANAGLSVSRSRAAAE